MDDVLAFRKLITPLIIQLVFWLGVIGVFVWSVAVIDSSPLVALLGLVLGVVSVRVCCELLIVVFRIHGTLEEIRRNTCK